SGPHVYFDETVEQPGSSRGDRLIAHKLTQVVQQRKATEDRRPTVSQRGEASEVEAERVSEAIVASGFSNADASLPREVTAVHIHRQVARDEAGDKGTKPGSATSQTSTLTAQEKQKLDNAGKLIEKASKNRTSAAEALKKYASVAPGKMTALKTSFAACGQLYA